MTSQAERAGPPHAIGRRIATLLEWVVLLVSGLVILVVALLVAEGASRLIHGGSHPLLPIKYVQGIFPEMHRGFTVRMDVPDTDPVEYVMNDLPARVASSAVGAGVPEVLVVGDSQALGWALPFERTVGSLVAAHLYGNSAGAMLLASPATDPELLLHNVREVRARWQADPKVAIFYVNFGNDLDEAFLGRQRHHFSRYPRLQDWLSTRSSLALDVNKIALAAALRNRMGVNEVLFSTNDEERRELAVGLADAAVAGLAMFGENTRKIVVLIPNDYQVDPAEFNKYEATYTDKTLFRKYANAVARMKRDMDAAYAACRARLEQSGQFVVDVKELAADRSGTFFDRYSHHLNATASAAVAQAIERRLSVPVDPPVGRRSDQTRLAGARP